MLSGSTLSMADVDVYDAIYHSQYGILVDIHMVTGAPVNLDNAFILADNIYLDLVRQGFLCD